MTFDPQRAYSKPDALNKLLRSHPLVLVQFDARAEGVIVPPQYREAPDLVLSLGLNLPIPIRDLYIDGKEWRATLSFGDEFFFCVVPWPAVYLITTDTGYGCAWDDAVPPEVLKKLRNAQEKAPQSPSGAAKRKLPPGWKVIDGGA